MDLYLDWGGDFILTPNGSLQTAVGWDNTRQRITRKAITNPAYPLADGTSTPADYVFDPTFGLGVGSLIDTNPTEEILLSFEQKLTNAVMTEPGINPALPPTITFKAPNTNTLEAVVLVPLSNTTVGQLTIKVPT